MNTSVQWLIHDVTTSRLFKHPLFDHWAARPVRYEVHGAIFHQIQMFCASTRPALNFPSSLKQHGFMKQSELIEEIVAGEKGHGQKLAAMAAHIINRSEATNYFSDIYDQVTIEKRLKLWSDFFLHNLPGYDPSYTGLTIQAQKAIAVFERRKNTDYESTVSSLGTSFALEIISKRQIIPGEVRALVESGYYGVNLGDGPMEYLREHFGEGGAEDLHEKNVIAAITDLFEKNPINPKIFPLIQTGIDDFLESLAKLWDVLDTTLLQSGF